MKIVEIFETIQGEGPSLGKPSVFVRFGGCNLRCQFKSESCDTAYAVFTPQQLDKKNPVLKAGYNKWYDFTVEQLITTIKMFKSNHIVFTGGEPLLYQSKILQVVKSLYDLYTFDIETNGTISRLHESLHYRRLRYIVSAKLKSSNQEKGYEKKRIVEEALKSFLPDSDVYKFVISDRADIDEIFKILKINTLPVYLMPQGVTRNEVVANSQMVVDLCIKHRFRFSPREHIVVWDVKKGV